MKSWAWQAILLWWVHTSNGTQNRNRRMRNRMYGGVRGRKTKVGGKLLRFPPTRLGWLLGTILSKRIRIFSICSWLQFCVFVQCFMVIWWYFYRNYDTSMMLLCKHIWKYHFANRYVSVIYLQTMILWDFF